MYLMKSKVLELTLGSLTLLLLPAILPEQILLVLCFCNISMLLVGFSLLC
jgi:hypothetical protein